MKSQPANYSLDPALGPSRGLHRSKRRATGRARQAER